MKKSIIKFSFLLLFFIAVLFPSTSRAADVQTFDAYQTAAGNIQTGGKFVRNARGIRYRCKDGIYLKNCWALINGKVYKCKANGYMQKGSFRSNGCSYRTDRNAALYRNKRIKISGAYRCYGSTCALALSEWVNIDGKYYYFGSNGKMAVNRWIGRWYVGADGARITDFDRDTIMTASSESEQSNLSRLIIIGASRVQQMQDATDGSSFTAAGVTWTPIYIAKYSQGYNWYASYVVPRLRAYLSLFPKSKVVIQLGNNDIQSTRSMNISKYIRSYRSLIKLYPGTRFYFMDALPSDRTVLNAKRVIFNKKLKAAFPKNYIGGYDFLMHSGFTLLPEPDHGHYDRATYLKIFQYILEKTGLR